jgi:proteasome accessory factor C
MAVTDKALDLVRILKSKRDGITRKALQNRWNCAAVTVYRTVEKAKTILNAPISFDPAKGKYFCSQEQSIEAPGLWFRPDEMAALLGLSHWLESIGPGVLKHQLEPIQQRLEQMLESQSIPIGDWKDRIRLLPMASRQIHHGILVTAAEAVLRRIRVSFKYKGVRDADFLERKVSPQTLVRYRDNWFLDGFCHVKKGLRSFSLSRMKEFQVLSQPTVEITRVELDAYFADSYGIFSGKAKGKAVLLFEGLSARFVEEEQWHPRQKAHRLHDGRLRMEFPIGDMRELVRDLMRYADEVTVESPPQLRFELDGMVERASNKRKRVILERTTITK